MNDTQTPWTETQFKTAMRKAGWRLNGQVGTYTHKETGRVYHPYNWMAETGEDWRQWAAARQTPPPF